MCGHAQMGTHTAGACVYAHVGRQPLCMCANGPLPPVRMRKQAAIARVMLMAVLAHACTCQPYPWTSGQQAGGQKAHSLETPVLEN